MPRLLIVLKIILSSHSSTCQFILLMCINTWNYFILCMQPLSLIFFFFLRCSKHRTVRRPALKCVLSEPPPKPGAGLPHQPPLVPLPLATHPTWSEASTPLRRSKLGKVDEALSLSVLSLFLLFTCLHLTYLFLSLCTLSLSLLNIVKKRL